MASIIPKEGFREFPTLKLSFDRARSGAREKMMLKAQGAKMNWQTEGVSFVCWHPGSQPNILKKVEGQRSIPPPKCATVTEDSSQKGI